MNLTELQDLSDPSATARFAVCWQEHSESGEIDWDSESVYRFVEADIHVGTTAEECVLRDLHKLLKSDEPNSWSALGGFVFTLNTDGIKVRVRVEDEVTYTYETLTVKLADVEVELTKAED